MPSPRLQGVNPRSRGEPQGYPPAEKGSMHGTVGPEMGQMSPGQDLPVVGTEAPWPRQGIDPEDMTWQGYGIGKKSKELTDRLLHRTAYTPADGPSTGKGRQGLKVEPIEMTQIGLWYSWMGEQGAMPNDFGQMPGSAGTPDFGGQNPFGTDGGGGRHGGGGSGGGSRSRGGGGGGGRRRRGGGGSGGDGGGGGGGPGSGSHPAHTPYHDKHPYFQSKAAGGRTRIDKGKAHTPWHDKHPHFQSKANTGRNKIDTNIPDDGSHKAHTPWHDKHPYFQSKAGGGGTGGNRSDKQKVADEWRRQGMSDAGAAGAMANITDESSWKTGMREKNPTGNAKRLGGGRGLYQFTGQDAGHQGGKYNAWMAKNYPGKDPNDPTLSTRFVAEQIKRGDSVASKGGGAGKPGSTWEQMKHGTKEQAAQAFLHGYLRPRADHERSRAAKYGRGVPGLDKYGVGQSSGRSPIDTSIPSQPRSGGGYASSGGGGGTGGGDSTPQGGPGGRVSELQGGGTRNQAITPELRGQLEGAGKEAGVDTEVFSGGQPSSGPHRTGSHRHDHGQSADVYLRDPSTGHKLDMRNDADRGRMSKYITGAVKRGATGVGAAEKYMGPSGIHVGGGNPGTWGAGGRGPGPDWVQKAWRAGREAPPVKTVPSETATTRKPTMEERRFTGPSGRN